MTDPNAIARDYVAQLDVSIDRMPRALLMLELESAGLNPDSPLMLVLKHTKEEYISRAELKEMTDPPAMEFSEEDKAAFADILDPMLPNQPVPLSMWQAQLSMLALAHAHAFMQDIFNRPETTELTREAVHGMAIKHGLEVLPLAIPEAALHAAKMFPSNTAAQQEPDNAAPVGSTPAAEPVAAVAVQTPMRSEAAPAPLQQAGLKEQTRQYQERQQQQAGGDVNYGFAGGLIAGALNGAANLVKGAGSAGGSVLSAINPFAASKAAFNQSRSHHGAAAPAEAAVTSGLRAAAPVVAADVVMHAEDLGQPELATDDFDIDQFTSEDFSLSTADFDAAPVYAAGTAKAVADEIESLTQQLRENRSPESVEAITEALASASERIDTSEDISPEDRLALKDSLTDLKETIDNEFSPEEKRTLGEKFLAMMKVLMELFKKLFSRDRQVENDDSYSPA